MKADALYTAEEIMMRISEINHLYFNGLKGGTLVLSDVNMWVYELEFLSYEFIYNYQHPLVEREAQAEWDAKKEEALAYQRAMSEGKVTYGIKSTRDLHSYAKSTFIKDEVFRKAVYDARLLTNDFWTAKTLMDKVTSLTIKMGAKDRMQAKLDYDQNKQQNMPKPDITPDPNPQF